jgi:hypothetical protein
MRQAIIFCPGLRQSGQVPHRIIPSGISKTAKEKYVVTNGAYSTGTKLAAIYTGIVDAIRK